MGVQHQADPGSQPAGKGGFAGAGRTVQAQPAGAVGGKAVGNRQQVRIAAEQRRVVAHRQGGRRVHRWQFVPLGAQGAVDQVADHLRNLVRVKVVPDGVRHLQGALQHGRGKVFTGGEGQQRLGGELHVPAGPAQNLLTSFPRRDGAFHHQVEAADKGRVQAVDRVGHPHRGHRVVFEHAVDPGLVLAGRGPTPGRGVGKHVLDLVEQQQAAPLTEKTLRHPKGPQPALAVHGVAVLVLTGHLEQFCLRLPGEQAGQLALARARRAVQEQVRSPAAGCEGVTEEGQYRPH